MGYAFTDLETGGLRSDENPILQLGCIVTDDDFEILEVYCSYVKPAAGLIITEEALAINKIDLEKCYNAPTEKEVLTEFNKIMHKHNYPTITGFNLQYDMGFLKSAAYRNKMYLRSDGVTLDLQLANIHFTDSRKYSLKSACEEKGLTPGDHTALRDCYAYIGLAKEIFKVNAQAKN